MLECPKCSYSADEDVNFCPKCGTRLGVVEPTVQLVSADTAPAGGPIEPDLTCSNCNKGTLVLVEGEPHKPLYMCDSCHWYFGDFLHLGEYLYYDTTILKVARYIKAEVLSRGHYRIGVGDHTEGEGLAALASRLAMELDMELPLVEHALGYCFDNHVMETYREPDGSTQGLRFIRRLGNEPGMPEIPR